MKSCNLYKKVTKYSYTDESYRQMTLLSIVNEPWIVEDSLTNAIRWRQRYRKRRRRDFGQRGIIPREQSLYNNTVGLIGEFIFDGLLDRLNDEKGVSHYWAKPYYPPDDPRSKRTYDFDIYDFGKIEIKTIAPISECERLLISKEGCERSEADYVIGLKLYYKNGMLMEPNEVKTLDWNEHLLRSVYDAMFVGWLSEEELEELDTAEPDSDEWCKESCYWTFIDRVKASKNKIHPLNSIIGFWKKLEEEVDIALFP